MLSHLSPKYLVSSIKWRCLEWHKERNNSNQDQRRGELVHPVELVFKCILFSLILLSLLLISVRKYLPCLWGTKTGTNATHWSSSYILQGSNWDMSPVVEPYSCNMHNLETLTPAARNNSTVLRFYLLLRLLSATLSPVKHFLFENSDIYATFGGYQ